jgi:hypothetical protein
MRSIVCAVVVALGFTLMPAIASADVVVTWRRVTGDRKAAPMTVVETISGMKQREDELGADGAATFSAIRDLVSGREVLAWHAFKLKQELKLELRSAKPAAREETVERRVRTSAGKPTGRTETILGIRCREYAFVAVSYDSKFVVNGTYWLAEDAPGDAEYAALYERFGAAVVEKEPGGVSKGNKARMRGRLELRREFLAAARRAGIPYRMEFEVTGSGIAPIYLKQEAIAISTDKVSPGVFDAPASYKIRP